MSGEFTVKTLNFEGESVNILNRLSMKEIQCALVCM